MCSLRKRIKLLFYLDLRSIIEEFRWLKEQLLKCYLGKYFQNLSILTLKSVRPGWARLNHACVIVDHGTTRNRAVSMWLQFSLTTVSREELRGAWNPALGLLANPVENLLKLHPFRDGSFPSSYKSIM